MSLREFGRAGHSPTLLSAFLHFDVSFMVWVILGSLTERIGGRKTGLIGLAVTLIPLALGWRSAQGFYDFLGLGLLLGIAGAGNSGTIFATLFAPRLAQLCGWRLLHCSRTTCAASLSSLSATKRVCRR